MTKTASQNKKDTTQNPQSPSKTIEQQEQDCLNYMNNNLNKLKITQTWDKYEDIRLIGMPNRNIFYTIIGIVFPLLYIFGTSYRLFAQQNVVLQITGVVLAFVIKSSLPIHTFTIQFQNKDKVEINVNDKDRFIIVQNMYQFMRDQETYIRSQKIDQAKFNKKK